MKKFVKILVLLVAVALAGCRTDNDFGFGGTGADNPTPDNGVNNSEVVPLSLAVRTYGDSQEEDFDTNPSTRTVLDELYKYYWFVNDKIGLSAVDASDNACVFGNVALVNNAAGKNQSTVFEGVLDRAIYDQMTAEHYNYTAYYPYNADAVCATNGNGDLIISGLELPAVQSVSILGVEGFPSNYDFMITAPALGATLSTVSVNNLPLEFRHLFAAIQLNITDDKFNGGKEKVTKIVLTAPEGTPLTGKFNVNTTTGEVKFTESSNTVTVDMTAVGGMGKSDDCVWAIVNPAAINGNVVLSIETDGGLNYTYTYPKTKGYAQGVFNKLNLEIPAFSISANVYTSYTRYAAGDVAGANTLHGSAIYFSDIKIEGGSSTPDGNGGTYEIPYVESGIVCNNVRETFSKGTTSKTYTCTAASQWGEYDAQVYVKFANGQYLTTKYSKVQVTGIPFNRYVVSNSFSGGGVPFNGSDGEGAMNSPEYPWKGKNMNANKTNPWRECYVVSVPFYAPSAMSVKVRGWFSTSVTGSTFEAGAVKEELGVPSTTVGVNIPNVSTSDGAYYEFPSFSLTPNGSRVCLYDGPNAAYFRIFKVAVSYAQ